MDIDARPQFQRRVHAHTLLAFDLATVVTHVLNPVIRVLGDVLRQRRVWRVVPAGRGDRHWDAIKPLSVHIEIRPLPDNFLTRCGRHLDRIDRVGGRVFPGRFNFVELTPDARAVDVTARGEHTHCDWYIELPAF